MKKTPLFLFPILLQGCMVSSSFTYEDVIFENKSDLMCHFYEGGKYNAHSSDTIFIKGLPITVSVQKYDNNPDFNVSCYDEKSNKYLLKTEDDSNFEHNFARSDFYKYVNSIYGNFEAYKYTYFVFTKISDGNYKYYIRNSNLSFEASKNSALYSIDSDIEITQKKEQEEKKKEQLAKEYRLKELPAAIARQKILDKINSEDVNYDKMSSHQKQIYNYVSQRITESYYYGISDKQTMMYIAYNINPIQLFQTSKSTFIFIRTLYNKLNSNLINTAVLLQLDSNLVQEILILPRKK